MEYIQCIKLSDHPHVLKRYLQWGKANQADNTWCALFKTKGYKRMRKHQLACSQNFRNHITRNCDLTISDSFTVRRIADMGYVVFFNVIDHAK